MTEGIAVFIAGVEAARRGDDPRECPYDKMTCERYEWERGQRWGVEIVRMDEELDHHMKGAQ